VQVLGRAHRRDLLGSTSSLRNMGRWCPGGKIVRSDFITRNEHWTQDNLRVKEFVRTDNYWTEMEETGR
jgi:hypothetical protein